MRKTFIILCLVCCWFSNVNAQNATCVCPKNDSGETIPDTLFTFSNGKQIAVCGHKNDEGLPISYSEFALAVCGENDVIGFWDGTEACKVEMIKDTLNVTSLKNLPVGTDFKYHQVDWSIEKFFFSNGKLENTIETNRKLPKYNQSQINTVLKDYKASDLAKPDEKSVLANRLFIASISGSKTARKQFLKFDVKNKTIMDGAIAEEYKELAAMFELWNNTNH